MNSVAFFQYVFDAIRLLLQLNTNFFQQTGYSIFHSFAVMGIMWFGVEAGFAAAAGHQFPWGRFVNFIMVLSIGYAMIVYYNSAIPGIGYSFVHLITDQASWMANKITMTMVQTLTQRLAIVQAGLEIPLLTDTLGVFAYYTTIILLLLCEALAFLIIGYGFVAEAICVLVGPIFIPFFIVPKMDWMFWGWLRAFLQYSFFQVIAAAAIFIVGNVLVPGWDHLPTFLTIPVLVAALPVIFAMMLFCLAVIIAVPAITNHIFSGSAGGGVNNAFLAIGARWL